MFSKPAVAFDITNSLEGMCVCEFAILGFQLLLAYCSLLDTNNIVTTVHNSLRQAYWWAANIFALYLPDIQFLTTAASIL